MPLSTHDANELHRLLSEIWDRGVTPERLEYLEDFTRLHGEPAHEEIIAYASMHSELAASASSSRAFEASVASIFESSLNFESSAGLAASSGIDSSGLASSGLASVGGSLATQDCDTQQKSSQLKSKSSSLRALTWLTIASGLLVAAGWGILWSIPKPYDHSQLTVTNIKLFRPPQPVASIIAERNAVWSTEYNLTELSFGERAFDEHDLRVGGTLKQGQILSLKAGSAQVSMACGADIVLQAPCLVELVADDLVRLESGKVTAQAADWATGFVIETKGLSITDLGTKFAVSADATGVTEAHVLEGAVLAEPLKDIRPKRSSMLLKKGQAVRVNLPQSTIDRIAANRTKFVDHLPTFRPLRPIRIWNTGLGGVVGQEDSHWTVVAGDPANGPYPRPAVVSHGDPVYLDNMPDASQWISVNSTSAAAPNSVHTFETRFDLTGYDLNTVCMVGLFLVDDAINKLTINGEDIPFERWTSSWDVQDFKRFRAVVIDHGFVPGENVISFDVYNSPNRPGVHSSNANPVGVRVEWQAFACESFNNDLTLLTSSRPEFILSPNALLPSVIVQD